MCDIVSRLPPDLDEIVRRNAADLVFRPFIRVFENFAEL